MPGLDGTGPGGMGPMTGGGFGRCADNNNARAGTGRGLARGRGRGFRRYANFSINEPIAGQSNFDESQMSVNQNESLRQQNKELAAKIDALNSTIDELKKG